MKHFKTSFIFTLIAFFAAYLWSHHTHLGHELSCLFIVAVLSILEISLSFDNAVVNAAKLEKMSEKWQKRFLTWGIFIAVFGMRFLFPILIVAIFARLKIGDVINMALNDADKYAYFLHNSHPLIITFGACFLIMLFFTFFFNQEKEIHWLKPIEKLLCVFGYARGLNVCLSLFILLVFHNFVIENLRHKTLIAGIAGIMTYLLIDGISNALEEHAKKKNQSCNLKTGILNSCFINFLYLELIDASFSLDGVLGAFALSKDIIIITLGLSIGAMFVRSLTLMLVEKKTLKQYIYLEHGAHWAIGALSIIMFISSFKEVNEIVTGFVGLFFIILSFLCSVIENKKNPQ